MHVNTTHSNPHPRSSLHTAITAANKTATKVCTQLWVVGDEAVTRFEGNFDAYKAHTLAHKRRDAKR